MASPRAVGVLKNNKKAENQEIKKIRAGIKHQIGVELSPFSFHAFLFSSFPVFLRYPDGSQSLAIGLEVLRR